MKNYTRRMLIGTALVMMATVFLGLSVTADNGWIAGTVGDNALYPYMGNAVSGATVSVVNGTQTTTTNATGYYNITVPEGNYTLKLTKTGFNDKTSSQLTVTANNTTTQNFYLVPLTGGVVGTVKDQDGTAVDMVMVTAQGYTVAFTDSSGKYSLQGLSVGTVTISFEEYGYDTQNVTVTVVANTNTTKDITLTMQTYVECTITGPEILGVPLPLEGATVTCGNATGTTDALGMVQLSVEPGTYTMTVSASDYKTYTKSVTVARGANTFSAKLNKTSGENSTTNGILFGLGAICLIIILVPLIILILIIYLVIRWMRGKKAQAAQQPPQPPAPPLPPPQGPPFPPSQGQTPPPPPAPPQG